MQHVEKPRRVSVANTAQSVRSFVRSAFASRQEVDAATAGTMTPGRFVPPPLLSRRSSAGAALFAAAGAGAASAVVPALLVHDSPTPDTSMRCKRIAEERPSTAEFDDDEAFYLAAPSQSDERADSGRGASPSTSSSLANIASDTCSVSSEPAFFLSISDSRLIRQRKGDSSKKQHSPKESPSSPQSTGGSADPLIGAFASKRQLARERAGSSHTTGSVGSAFKPVRKCESAIRILVTDPMGAVNSRERRASSIGCWTVKSPRSGEDEYSPAPPTKLCLDSPVNLAEPRRRQWEELPTPTSGCEDEEEGSIEAALARGKAGVAETGGLSSHDKLMQVIRCFPFPSTRESPRLRRRLLPEHRINGARHDSEKNGNGKCCPSGEGGQEGHTQHEDGNIYKSAFGHLVRVSVETMAITALPRESFECWLKERLKKWIQLSGHEGSIIPASCTSLYKKQTGTCTEGVSYKAIQAEPALREFAPKYYQEIEKNNEMFIEIEDLLSRFEDPAHTAIMDIKIGTRTFLESEVSNTKMRADLYKKMTDIDPFEATEEERERGEITKLRYMQFRERESSTAQLGFRIEAAKTPGGALEKNFKKVRTAADVTAVLRNFFGPDRKRVVEGLLSRLRDLRRAVEQSTFFKQHEVVGSSLLLLFDGSKVGVWMIDFAKASRLPPGKTLTHRASWQPGNAEDGYLIGIDNLIQILEDMPLKEPALSVIEERER